MLTAVSVMTAILSIDAQAAAFQIQEQNTTHLGFAYNGTAVHIEDASSIFYNPATPMLLSSDASITQSMVVASAVMDATVTSALDNLGSDVSGDAKVDPAGEALLPAVAMHYRVNPNWAVGLSIAPPFGLKTVYDNASIVRYTATKSSLAVVEVSPVVATRLNDQWVVGAGLGINHAKAMLDVRLGTGDITTDGYQKNEASDWALSWRVGAVYQPTADLKFGAQYRSDLPVKAKGQSRTLYSGSFSQKTLSANVALPKSLLLSAEYDYNDRLSFLSDIHWTNWSEFQHLYLHYRDDSTGAISATRVDEHFNNTYRMGLAAHWKADEAWTYRVGVTHDPSPVRAKFRTFRIPDSDRLWVAMGGSYQYQPNMKIDFGFAHLFFKDSRIADAGPIAVASEVPVTFSAAHASVNAKANILGIQVSWDF